MPSFSFGIIPCSYDFIVELVILTSNGVSLNNTSLNRRGAPVVCSLTAALNMFYGSDLEYLVMKNVLALKNER